MSTYKLSKINHLLSTAPSGVVLTSGWLAAQGYSLDLQQRYKKSNWFTSLGRGALVRSGDEVDYLGGVYALQSQLGLSIHPAAKTALMLQGKSHYLEFSTKKVQVFCPPSDSLPSWFANHDWGSTVDCIISSFLPPGIGMAEFKHKAFTIKISSPARAVMECLYLAPKTQPLIEIYELMEGLNNLRPTTIQILLESCTSVKVKRLFLYMAEKAGHEWLTYIKLDKIDLGTGKRQIVSNGTYVSKYQITVPKELEN